MEGLEKDLELLRLDIKESLSNISKDQNDFHSEMNLLTSKYPEHRDLINFIVFIYDKHNTNQLILTDTIWFSLNEIVKTNKNIIRNIIKLNNVAKEKHKNNQPKFQQIFEVLKNMKVIVVSGAIITLGILYIKYPDEITKFIKIILG